MLMWQPLWHGVEIAEFIFKAFAKFKKVYIFSKFALLDFISYQWLFTDILLTSSYLKVKSNRDFNRILPAHGH